MIRAALAWLAAPLLALLALPALAGGGPAETVVLVNSSSADSRRVAEHYVKRRDIPAEQVCEVTCTTSLDVPMDAFVHDVVDPLRRFLHERGLEQRCRFVVMTQGMPIRAQTPGGSVSAAAALSLLHTPICGQPQAPLPHLRHTYTMGACQPGAQIVEGPFLLVTALISSTADEAIALVDRSVASDGTAPAGARVVFQDASGAANVRDRFYDEERKDLEARGIATEHAPVGANAVRDRERVIGYMSGGSYSGLTVDGVNSNKYLPGAICDMLQSFGAVPANFDPALKGASQFPITHMVRAGVTGVHGAVQEPYNVTFPDWQLFRPYVQGFTLAETFHQRMPYVYWMNLTLGDPLCAPYAKRPAPKLSVKGAWEGVVAAEVAAPGAVRIDVYDGARHLGGVQGAAGTVSIDTAGWRTDVPHSLLVEATGEGPAEPRGWTVVQARAAKNQPAAAAPVSSRTPCDRLVVEAPAEARAGEAATIRVTAADAEGHAIAGWKGRIEVRSSTPPVRWACVDADGAAEIPLTFTRTGAYELRVTAPDDGREAPVKFTVGSGDFDHVTTPLQTFPLGQECDMELVAEDRFGNRVRDYEATVTLSVPTDRFAESPLPAEFTAAHGGSAVLRRVLLTQEGPASLVFKDGAGRVLSAQDEGVRVTHTAIRPWLVAGPAPAKELFAADPAAAATGDGSVAGKLLLRRRLGGDVLDLPAGNAKGGEASVAVTWIDALDATKARLLASAPGRLRVWLDGKEVFDGVPAPATGGGRSPVADVQVAAGRHRLTVVAESKEPAKVSFDLDDGAGKPCPMLRIRARSADTPKSFTVSGRVVGGPGAPPVRGATITILGSDGRERTATSGADGVFWVAGLPAGETTVKVSFRTDVFADPERKLTIEDENLTDVDFGSTGQPQRGAK
jgi:uncharacterized protein (TIGR03790 family)